MDYINYVKQYPMSMGGMGGVVGSYNFRSGASGDYDPCTGGGGAGASTRGIMAGGFKGPSFRPYDANNIEYITVATTGNGTDFGDLTHNRQDSGGVGNATRGLIGGGHGPGGEQNIIDYITFASTGNATDFGDLMTGQHGISSNCNDCVRGIFAGGTQDKSMMQYVTMATTGNAQDFGDTTFTSRNPDAVSSPTRGVLGAAINDTLEYITFNSLGNTTDFGDLNWSSTYGCAASNNTRGIFVRGSYASMDYIDIGNISNAANFGNLTNSDSGMSTGVSSDTRFVRCGGQPPISNIMDYVAFASASNASDFGDMNQTISARASTSNGNGGL